jgi:hypothetical protein
LLLVLIPSFLVYAAVQATDLSVPAYPEGHAWYFNPLAWQFLFTAGAALGLGEAGAGPRLHAAGAPLLMAIVIAGVGLIIKLSWTIHGVWDPFPGLFLKELWPVNKNNLSPIRLVAFFAIVFIVSTLVSPNIKFLHSPMAKPFIRCGQQSLEIFCFGILLSALGHFLLSEYNSALLTQLAVNVAGVLVLFATAKMIAWYKGMSRTTAGAAPSRGNGMSL